MANITESNYKVYLGKIATHAKAYCTIATYPNSSSQLPSVEALYGIYNSKSTAHITLCNWFGDISDATSSTPCTAIPRGFTVAVEENDTVVEYQYKKEMPSSGYTATDLEVKGLANVDASDVSYGSSNVETTLLDIEEDIHNLKDDVGTISSLETTYKQNLVGAVNEVNTNANSANTKIGILASLHTTNKTTIVDAINEVKDAIPTSMSAENITYNSSGNHTIGSIAEAVNSAEESIQSLDSEVYNINESISDLTDSIEGLRSDVGDLSDLDTPAQDLVSAINSGVTSASNSATAAAASSAAAQQASTSAVNAAQSVLDELDNFPASQDATVLQHGTRITTLESTSVHDLSVMYSSSYANLSAALNALDADTSASTIKVGGMSIKFINSTTNKYEQWNLKASSWSTDTSNWGNTNVTQASEVDYNGQSLSNILPPLDNISKQNIQSEEQAIIYETNGGVQVGKIDVNGADFTNLKRDGQQVARMSDLPTKDGSIGENPSTTNVPTTKAVKDYVDANAMGDLPISKETTQSEEEEISIGNDTGTQTYVKAGSYGVKAPSFRYLDGSNIIENTIGETPSATHAPSSSAVVSYVAAHGGSGSRPVNPVILDTDFGGDIDDVNAVAVLCWGERMGLIDIVGICSSTPRFGKNDANKEYDQISAIDAVCNYFGLSDIAFGLDKTYWSKTSAYCGTACTYPFTTDSAQAYDAPEFYRRALSALPAGVKCKVVIVGYLTAFSRFLSSPADSISNKTGLELASDKIDTLYIMGGKYPNGMVETNLADGGKAYMVNASNNVMTNFPNKIIWLGAELSYIHVGDVLYDNTMEWSILYDCMNEFMTKNFQTKQAAGTLPSGVTDVETYWKYYDFAWDPQAVLAAIDKDTDISGFDVVQGTNSIITTAGADYGKNVFTPSDSGKHFYVVCKATRKALWYSKRLDSIVEEKNWLSHKSNTVRLQRASGATSIATFDITITPSKASNPLNMPYTIPKGSVLYIWMDSLPEVNDGAANGLINFYQSDDQSGTFCQFDHNKGIKFGGSIVWDNLTQLKCYVWAKLISYTFHFKLVSFN